MTTEDIYAARHQAMVLPSVRVIAAKGGGSGTVLYSEKNISGTYSTYILTNHHVIADLISMKDEWSPILKRPVKTDVLGQPIIHFFDYRWESRATGSTAMYASIVTYDANEDLALLKIDSEKPAPAVAKMLAKSNEKSLRVTMELFAVGAGLGEPPVTTTGMLSRFGIMMDNREFWLNTAPIIHGNSGGALFLGSTMEMIGVPSQVAVQMNGFSQDPITHMSYAIPITRVYDFLDKQMFSFVYDPSHTEEGDEAARAAIREQDQRGLAGREQRA